MRNPGNREEGVLRLKKPEKSEVSLHDRAAPSQIPCLAMAYSASPLKKLWEQFFPVLYREGGYVGYFNYLCFHHLSKQAEWKEYIRKLFFRKLQIHGLSIPPFLWVPEFPDVFLTRTVAVIYYFVLSEYFDHNSANPVNPTTVLMGISLGKCSNLYTVLKPFLSPPPFYFFFTE